MASLESFFKSLDTLEDFSFQAETDFKRKQQFEVNFDLLAIGRQSQFDVIPTPLPLTRVCPLPPSASEFPLLPSRSDKPSILNDLEEEYLNLRSFIHRPESLRHQQKWWPRQIFPEQKAGADACLTNGMYQMEVSAPRTTLEIVIAEQNGEVTGFREVALSGFGHTPFNSMSLDRPLGNREDFHRGSTENQPFMPGGVEPQQSPISSQSVSDAYQADASLKNIPPGFHGPVSFGNTASIQIELTRLADKTSQVVSNPADMIAPYADMEDVQDERQISRKREEFMTQMENKKREILSYNSLYADDEDE